MPIWRTQVRITYGGEGGPGYNSFHFRTTNGDSGLPDAIERLRLFYDAIKSVYARGVAITSDGQWSRVDQQGLGVDLPGWRIPAQSEGDPTPPFCAIGLQYRTLRAGRTGRGRSFIGPVRRDTVDAAGQVAQGTRQQIVTAAEQQLDVSTALDGAFVVWSRSAEVGSDFDQFAVPADFYSLTTRRD